MKINPAQQKKKKVSTEGKVLSNKEKITKGIALIIAFITVYYFFFKILFF